MPRLFKQLLNILISVLTAQEKKNSKQNKPQNDLSTEHDHLFSFLLFIRISVFAMEEEKCCFRNASFAVIMRLVHGDVFPRDLSWRAF